MKKTFLLFSFCFFLFSFAAIDTDSDSVSDEKDLCPRVYARSETGCPALADVTPTKPLNACYQEQENIFIARVTPICDVTNKVCPVISSLAGVQICDPIFPLILQDGKPFVRGGIYIIWFSR